MQNKTQKKTNSLLTVILVVIAFLGGFTIATYNGGGKMPVDESKQERDSSYKFISPLLECDIRGEKSQQKYIPFEKDLKNRIQREVIDKNPNIHVSLYFRNLKNGPWFGINEEESFAPASLMKIPVSMSYMKWIESDPSVLTKRIPLAFETESKQNFIPKVRLNPNNTYTVMELIYEALVYSDNDANRTLVNNIPEDVLMRVFRDLGINIEEELKKGAEEYISVKEYASFFRILYNASYLERGYSEKLLEILTKSDFTNGIQKYIPDSIPIAHKFGERIFYSEELKSNVTQLHDCGIVYYEKYPYLLCIMTKGVTDFGELEKVIQNSSRIVFETISKIFPE